MRNLPHLCGGGLLKVPQALRNGLKVKRCQILAVLLPFQGLPPNVTGLTS
jgi:hypothetical protein